jgi:hypothetical protein
MAKLVKKGRRGFVLTLATREQTFSAKALICTNGDVALAATVYLETRVVAASGKPPSSRAKSHYAARNLRLEGFRFPSPAHSLMNLWCAHRLKRPRYSIASPARRLLMAASRYHGLILTVRMIFSSAQLKRIRAHRLMRSSKD